MKACTQCGASFLVTDEDRSFYEKISPVFHGEKYSIPEPTHCPDCRQQRRLIWRNERSLYFRNCDATGKKIFSVFHENAPFAVYNNEYWWGDNWNALDYGKDFDFNRSFFDQFEQLYNQVPHYSLLVVAPTMQNSDYCNCAGYLKDCYLVVNADDSEKCMYSKGVNDSFDCIDCFKVTNCESCYETQNSDRCYNCHYLLDSEGSSDCYFSTDLISCKHCFGCSNLRNKEYYFFNKKMQKDEWQAFVKAEIEKHTPKEILKKVLEQERIVKYMEEIQCENVSGNYLIESKNCTHCYDSQFLENSKYCYDLKKGESISFENYDICYFGRNITRCYEANSIGYNAESCLFGVDVYTCSNMIYAAHCVSSHDCFGCVGLRNKQYCIFNKQYTKEEYETLVPQIITHMKKTGEWGEFFPAKLSPFAYNETVVQEYFPLMQEQVLKKNWKWRKEVDYIPNVTKKIPAERLPESINDIPDDILNWAIVCERSGRPFKITKQELDFYRRHNLPVPHFHPDERHKDRLATRNPRKLYERSCDKCQKAIQTTYAPERPETVYCEECYLAEIY